MASDFIQLKRTDTAATEVQNTLQAINQFRAAVVAITSVRSKMQHCISDPDFTLLESLFGASAGQGQTLFALFDGTISALNSTGYAADLQAKVG